jgi:hypothetical protein
MQLDALAAIYNRRQRRSDVLAIIAKDDQDQYILKATHYLNLQQVGDNTIITIRL